MVEGIVESNKIIDKQFADYGAYNGKEIFRYLLDNRILTCIKLEKNAQVQLKKERPIRNLTGISQRNDLQNRKDSIISYGQRWIVEKPMFSSIKRRSDGESVCLFCG